LPASHKPEGKSGLHLRSTTDSLIAFCSCRIVRYLMGCQHSCPVPVANDFYYLPSSRDVTSDISNVETIETPGMCYGLTYYPESTVGRVEDSMDGQSSKKSSACRSSSPGLQLRALVRSTGNCSNRRCRCKSNSSKVRRPCPGKRLEVCLVNSSDGRNFANSCRTYTLNPCGPIFCHGKQWCLNNGKGEARAYMQQRGPLKSRSRDMALSKCSATDDTTSTCSSSVMSSPESKRFKSPASSWNLVVGPGIDPCLFLCMAAIVNQNINDGEHY